MNRTIQNCLDDLGWRQKAVFLTSWRKIIKNDTGQFAVIQWSIKSLWSTAGLQIWQVFLKALCQTVRPVWLVIIVEWKNGCTKLRKPGWLIDQIEIRVLKVWALFPLSCVAGQPEAKLYPVKELATWMLGNDVWHYCWVLRDSIATQSWHCVAAEGSRLLHGPLKKNLECGLWASWKGVAKLCRTKKKTYIAT